MIAANSQQANRDHPEENQVGSSEDPFNRVAHRNSRSYGPLPSPPRRTLTGNPEVGGVASAGALSIRHIYTLRNQRIVYRSLIP